MKPIASFLLILFLPAQIHAEGLATTGTYIPDSLEVRAFIPPAPPIPKPPEAAPDTIAINRGNANDPVGTSTVTLLRDLIATEKFRLIVYQEERAIYQ